MSVLLAGATGLVGPRVLDLLCAAGTPVSRSETPFDAEATMIKPTRSRVATVTISHRSKAKRRGWPVERA